MCLTHFPELYLDLYFSLLGDVSIHEILSRLLHTHKPICCMLMWHHHLSTKCSHTAVRDRTRGDTTLGFGINVDNIREARSELFPVCILLKVQYFEFFTSPPH